MGLEPCTDCASVSDVEVVPCAVCRLCAFVEAEPTLKPPPLAWPPVLEPCWTTLVVPPPGRLVSLLVIVPPEVP